VCAANILKEAVIEEICVSVDCGFYSMMKTV